VAAPAWTSTIDALIETTCHTSSLLFLEIKTQITLTAARESYQMIFETRLKGAPLGHWTTRTEGLRLNK
jgi:hypothetical protein